MGVECTRYVRRCAADVEHPLHRCVNTHSVHPTRPIQRPLWLPPPQLFDSETPVHRQAPPANTRTELTVVIIVASIGSDRPTRNTHKMAYTEKLRI